MRRLVILLMIILCWSLHSGYQESIWFLETQPPTLKSHIYFLCRDQEMSSEPFLAWWQELTPTPALLSTPGETGPCLSAGAHSGETKVLGEVLQLTDI